MPTATSLEAKVSFHNKHLSTKDLTYSKKIFSTTIENWHNPENGYWQDPENSCISSLLKSGLQLLHVEVYVQVLTLSFAKFLSLLQSPTDVNKFGEFILDTKDFTPEKTSGKNLVSAE